MHPRRAHVLGGAGHAEVARVDVHLHRVGQVARHHRALVEVDVLHGVDQAGDVVGILRERLAVLAGDRVHHVDGRARGAEVDLLAPRLHVELRVLRVQREVAGGDGQRVLDERPREQQAAVLGERAALRQQHVEAAVDGIGQPDVLQHVQRGFVHLAHLGVGEWLVAARGHARVHRPHVVGERCRAQGHARCPPAPPTRLLLNVAHVCLHSLPTACVSVTR